jgi:SAM-dependent methyltransferase
MRWPSEDVVELLLPGGPLPVRYIAAGDSIFLIASDDEATWPVEILRRGTVELRTSDGSRSMRAGLVVGRAAREQVLDLFRRRYAPADVGRWFPRPGRMLRLDAGRSAPKDPYRAWLSQEFDAAADTYAERVLSNPVEAQARRRSSVLLARTFRDRARLLELGSGPGLETIPLLEAGHEVTAVDASAAMLRRLELRADEAGVRGRLTTLTSDMSDLAALSDDPFDGAYSTFGALNCAPDLSQLRTALAGRLRPGAPLLAGVYNRVSLPELGWYGLGGHPARALARLNSPVRVGSSRFSVDWYPWTSGEIKRSFAPEFRWSSTQGIGLIAPPPELSSRLDHLPVLLPGLLRLDSLVDRTILGNLFGDQLMVRLHRVGSGG